jgi:AcrR family transcriptional regulator
MAKNLQEKILATASELFYSQGIRATGVDAIAKAANTTKMSLYKYFPSKEELVIAFLRKRDEDFRTWFVAQVDAKAADPKDKLMAINASAEFPLEGNPVHQLSVEFYDKFRHYIADLAGQCGAKSAESLALQLSLLVEGAIVSEQMKRHSGAAEQAKQAAIMLINGSLT